MSTSFVARLRRLDDVPEKTGRYVVLHRGMTAGHAYYTAKEGDTQYPVGWSQLPNFNPSHWLDAPCMEFSK
jgi:hypothetical protein